MGTLNITMKMIILDQDRTWMAPASGASLVFAIGTKGTLEDTGFKSGMDISNPMEIGDGLMAMVAQKVTTIRRYSDLYSLDIYQAFEKNKRTICIVEFSVKDGDSNQTAVLGIFQPKIKLFEPHTNSQVANIEKIRLEFDSGDARVTYGTTIEHAQHYYGSPGGKGAIHGRGR
jgi:hypothetical protein